MSELLAAQPGTRRWPTGGSPAASGETRSRHRRTACPNSFVFISSSMSGRPRRLVLAVLGNTGVWLVRPEPSQPGGMNVDRARPPVGFIGLGDQGLPMARPSPRRGFPCTPGRDGPPLDGLRCVSNIRHDSIRNLAAACDIVGLCVSADEDILQLAEGGLPGGPASGCGPGEPRHRPSRQCGAADRDLRTGQGRGPGRTGQRRAPGCGGATADHAGRRTADDRGALRAPFASFSHHIVRFGGTGAGQTAMLVNNALLTMNQASIAEIVDLAIELDGIRASARRAEAGQRLQRRPDAAEARWSPSTTSSTCPV